MKQFIMYCQSDKIEYEYLKQNKHLLLIPDKYGWTPMHTLCENKKITKEIIILGGINIRDNDGWTPFHSLCKFAPYELLKLGNLNIKAKFSWTPMHIICARKDITIEMVKLGNLDILNDENLSAFNVLCKNHKMTKHMVKLGDLNNGKNLFNNTPVEILYGTKLFKYAVYTLSLNKNYDFKDTNYKLYCEGKLFLTKKNYKYMKNSDVILPLLYYVKKNTCIFSKSSKFVKFSKDILIYIVCLSKY